MTLSDKLERSLGQLVKLPLFAVRGAAILLTPSGTGEDKQVIAQSWSGKLPTYGDRLTNRRSTRSARTRTEIGRWDGQSCCVISLFGEDRSLGQLWLLVRAIAPPDMATRQYLKTVCEILELMVERDRAMTGLIEHRDQLQTMVDDATCELRNKALELRESLENQKRVNVRQRHFISMASHEFRTPLAIIDGNAQRLGRHSANLDPATIDRHATKIRNAVSRITGLIETLLGKSAIETGNIDLKIDAFSPRDSIEEFVVSTREFRPKPRSHLILPACPSSIMLT